MRRRGPGSDLQASAAECCEQQYAACVASITIRDVPDDARDELAARAARSGRSLQEFLRLALIDLAARPDAGDLARRIVDRKRRTDSAVSTEHILEHLDAGRR